MATRSVPPAGGAAPGDAPGSARQVPRLRAKTPAGLVAAAWFGQHVPALLTGTANVYRGDPEAVHHARVTLRRLRSGLRTFRSVLAPDPELATRLRAAGSLLTDVRDADVLLERLQQAVQAVPIELRYGPVQARIEQELRSRRTRSLERVRSWLDGADYATLSTELAALAAGPRLVGRAARPANAVLPEELQRAQRRFRRRVRNATALGREAAPAWHEARKAAKHARYCAEALAPVLGRKTDRLAAGYAEVQQRLGAKNDAANAVELLIELGRQAHAQGENAFTYGLLVEQQRRAQLGGTGKIPDAISGHRAASGASDSQCRTGKCS